MYFERVYILLKPTFICIHTRIQTHSYKLDRVRIQANHCARVLTFVFACGGGGGGGVCMRRIYAIVSILKCNMNECKCVYGAY